MKTKVMTTVASCDNCGKKEALWNCIRCGKDFCYECKSKVAVEYQEDVFFNIYGNNIICKECDAEIARNHNDKFYPLRQAYQKIITLRRKAESFNKQLNEDAKDATNCVKYFQKELGVK